MDGARLDYRLVTFNIEESLDWVDCLVISFRSRVCPLARKRASGCRNTTGRAWLLAVWFQSISFHFLNGVTHFLTVTYIRRRPLASVRLTFSSPLPCLVGEILRHSVTHRWWEKKRGERVSLLLFSLVSRFVCGRLRLLGQGVINGTETARRRHSNLQCSQLKRTLASPWSWTFDSFVSLR